MNVLSILCVSLTVADLAVARVFYEEALGFSALDSVREADPALTRLLGGGSMRSLRLGRGRQFLELAEFTHRGNPYPSIGSSNDLGFQHLALATDDVTAAVRSLAGTPYYAISHTGAQRLPDGTVAYKFRDPEGHPLEFIAVPDQDPMTAGDIDHTAISMADAEASIGFYTGSLGFAVKSRQVNTGPAQDELDGLDGTLVDVVALVPSCPAPHLELLCYRKPRGRRAGPLRPADGAASRLVLLADDLSRHAEAVTLSDGSRAALTHDPDGHALLLVDDGG